MYCKEELSQLFKQSFTIINHFYLEELNLYVQPVFRVSYDSLLQHINSLSEKRHSPIQFQWYMYDITVDKKGTDLFKFKLGSMSFVDLSPS